MSDMTGSYDQAITRADVAATMPVWVAPTTSGTAHLDPTCAHLYAGHTRGRPRRPPLKHAALSNAPQGAGWVTVKGRPLRLCAFCSQPTA